MGGINRAFIGIMIPARLGASVGFTSAPNRIFFAASGDATAISKQVVVPCFGVSRRRCLVRLTNSKRAVQKKVESCGEQS